MTEDALSQAAPTLLASEYHTPSTFRLSFLLDLFHVGEAALPRACGRGTRPGLTVSDSGSLTLPHMSVATGQPPGLQTVSHRLALPASTCVGATGSLQLCLHPEVKVLARIAWGTRISSGGSRHLPFAELPRLMRHAAHHY